MILAKISTLFLVISLLVFKIHSKEGALRIYVIGVQCNVSTRFIYPNHSCYAKSFNRSFSAVNVVATAKKPLKDIQVS